MEERSFGRISIQLDGKRIKKKTSFQCNSKLNKDFHFSCVSDDWWVDVWVGWGGVGFEMQEYMHVDTL
jgi:hypothetical protein